LHWASKRRSASTFRARCSSRRRSPGSIGRAGTLIAAHDGLLAGISSVEPLPRRRFEGAFEREAAIKVAASNRAILFRYGRRGLRSFRRLTVRRNVGGWRRLLSLVGHVGHSTRLRRQAGVRQAEHQHAHLSRQRVPRDLLDRRRRPGLLRCELREGKQDTGLTPSTW